MIHDVGILLSSTSLSACLSGRASFERLPLYERFARRYHLRPVFFSLSQIRFDDFTVDGYIQVGNQYVQKKLPLPTVIHNRTRIHPAYDHPLDRLRRLPHTKVFNGTNYFNKWRVFHQLKQCQKLIPHLPDTHRLQPALMRQWLERYASLYLKPFARSLGRGILKCTRLSGDQVQISFQKNGAIYQQILSPSDVLPLIQHMCNKQYIVQQAIPLAQRENRPIDFRVSVQKGEQGTWTVSGIVAKMGLDHAIVTNVAAGGTCTPVRPLLEELFPSAHKKIMTQLKSVSLLVARQLEKRDPTCADLGLDLAVDQSGHVWIIEVNGRDLRITFRHAGENEMWQRTFKRPMAYASYLKKQQGVATSPGRKQPSVSILTPGALPLLSDRRGSVETVATHLAQALASRAEVRTVGTTSKPVSGRHIGLIRIPSSARNRSTYLKKAVEQMRRLPSDMIQIENRPTFVPHVRQSFPKARLILSLHSVTYVQPLARHALEKIFRFCDAVVTNSDFLKREMQSLVPCEADKVHRIHPGVDPAIFQPAEARASVRSRIRNEWQLGDRPIVLFIGRLIPQKGLHVLLQAMEHVRHEVPDVMLVVIGSAFYGRKQETAYVKKLKKEWNSAPHDVRFVPFISPQYIQDYYTIGDVFVTPSLGKEAFGLVNVEAMASGLPVVAHDVGGIREIVKHNETGYLISPKDSVQPLAEHIVTLLKDEGMRKAFGKAGRKKVKDRFTWERVATQYAFLYRKLFRK